MRSSACSSTRSARSDRAGARDGVPESLLKGAQASPVYKMAMDWKIAFPLYPQYRMLPMVWYVPPLSPISSAANSGAVAHDGVLPDVRSLRIPLRYLANLLTAAATTCC